MTWDNGDRTVLVNANLGGITIGWNLQHTAQDELFAAIEGTAFHTRVILDRMAEYGAPSQRVINGGGMPQNNPVLNQVYANVLNRPVLVPAGKVTGLGSAIFAFLAAGAFPSVEAAQDAVCPPLHGVLAAAGGADGVRCAVRPVSPRLFRFRQAGAGHDLQRRAADADPGGARLAPGFVAALAIPGARAVLALVVVGQDVRLQRRRGGVDGERRAGDARHLFEDHGIARRLRRGTAPGERAVAVHQHHRPRQRVAVGEAAHDRWPVSPS